MINPSPSTSPRSLVFSAVVCVVGSVAVGEVEVSDKTGIEVTVLIVVSVKTADCEEPEISFDDATDETEEVATVSVLLGLETVFGGKVSSDAEVGSETEAELEDVAVLEADVTDETAMLISDDENALEACVSAEEVKTETAEE